MKLVIIEDTSTFLPPRSVLITLWAAEVVPLDAMEGYKGSRGILVVLLAFNPSTTLR